MTDQRRTFADLIPARPICTDGTANSALFILERFLSEAFNGLLDNRIGYGHDDTLPAPVDFESMRNVCSFC